MPHPAGSTPVHDRGTVQGVTVPVPPGLSLETDVSPGQWVVDGLDEWTVDERTDRYRIGLVLPEGFQAYARILHRVEEGEWESGPNRIVRWDTIAEALGVTLQPDTRLRELSQAYMDAFGHRDVYGHESISDPDEGSLHPEELANLVELLAPFTSTPDEVWYCLWAGFGDWGGHTRKDRRVPWVRVPGREYFLYRGPLGRACGFQEMSETRPEHGHSPNIFWPDDRAWCVASEIDLDSTHVGGSRACIDALLDHPVLEAIEVLRSDPLW